MKTTKLVILTALFITVPVFTSCAGKNSKESAPKPVSQIEIFKSSEGWQKLDGRFRSAWENAMTKKDFEKSFECLLKTQGKPTNAEKKSLDEAGFHRRSVIGKISTGSIAAGDVPQVAALPFVKIMELAVPMSIKK